MPDRPSNPTRPLDGHPFVGPGEVAPGRPAPDACLACGRTGAAHQCADPARVDRYNQLVADESSSRRAGGPVKRAC